MGRHRSDLRIIRGFVLLVLLGVALSISFYLCNNQVLAYNLFASVAASVFTSRDIPISFKVLSFGEIAGKVVDSESLLPIMDASVTAGGFATSTDENGYYVISGVPLGDYTVTASANGYSRASKDVRIESGVTASVDFELLPRGFDSSSPLVLFVFGVIFSLALISAAWTYRKKHL